MRKNNNAMRVVFNGEGCATIVLLYTYTESVEEEKYDEGKEMEKERKRGEKCSWLDLNSAPLCCKDSV